MNPCFVLMFSLSQSIVDVMDHSCQDIPMKLDIKHQPLNFDIYLEQVIDVPKTSIDEPPYDFRLELEALKKVDKIIERTINGTKRAVIDSDQLDDSQMCPDQSPLVKFTSTSTIEPVTVTQSQEQCNSQALPSETTLSLCSNTDTLYKNPTTTTTTQTAVAPRPSCPMEIPLTPIKCFIEPVVVTDNALPSSTAPTSNKVTNCNSKQESPSDRITVNQINPRDFEEMHYNPFDHLELQTIDELKELDLVFQASYANQGSKQ